MPSVPKAGGWAAIADRLRPWSVLAGVCALAMVALGAQAQSEPEAPPAFPPLPTNRPPRFPPPRTAPTNRADTLKSPATSAPPVAATNRPATVRSGVGRPVSPPLRPPSTALLGPNVPPPSTTGVTALAGATNLPGPALTGAPPAIAAAPPVLSTNLPAPGPTNVAAALTNLPLPSLPPPVAATNLAGRQPPRTMPAPPPSTAPALPPPTAVPTLAEATAPTGTNLAGLAPDTLLPKGSFSKFQSAALEQVLQLYTELTGRVVLRPNQLPAQAITLDATAVELTKAEAIQALDSVLTLNGITMVPMGDKFVTAVQNQQALQEAAAFSSADPSKLPEASQYLTKIVTLKHALPSDVQQIIQSFAKVPNGILAIDGTQTLVLRDYAANIKRMTEIIKELDVEIESEYKLEVIPIKYGKVEDIYSTMSSLTGGGGGGAAGGGPRTRGRLTTGGGRTTGARSRGGLIGRQPGVGQQLQPQQPGAAGGFQQRLQQIVSRAAAGAGAGQLLGDARIVPDERSNSLIVYATKEDLQTITNIVDKVDRLLAQVLIEAIIMDVKLTDSKELGISLLMNPQRIGNLTSVAGSKNGPDLATNLTASGLPGAFSYFGRYGGDLDVAVKALAANGRGQVLQTPRIQTSHAMPASFFTGETVPYVTSTYYGGYGYGPSSSFQQLEVGIGLDVTPYITPDGLVAMDITQTIEEISGSTEISGVGKIPNTSRREATTFVSVQDRDTIMLGGYIRTSKTKTASGVPVLKDIPLLGNLFRSSSQDNARSELIVLLRPTVLKTPRDAAMLATDERDRLPGVREMEKQMNQEEQRRHEKADKATGRKRGEKSE
jgi:general secretion pathway protein D